MLPLSHAVNTDPALQFSSYQGQDTKNNKSQPAKQFGV